MCTTILNSIDPPGLFFLSISTWLVTEPEYLHVGSVHIPYTEPELSN